MSQPGFTTHRSEAQSHGHVLKSQHTLRKLSSQGNLVTTQAVQAADMTGSQFSRCHPVLFVKNKGCNLEAVGEVCLQLQS